jgi:hypothetical protein
MKEMMKVSTTQSNDVVMHYPIVRCVVMGSDSTENFSDVRDAVISTIKNIQTFYEDKIHIQFVFPANITREGWSPLRGVPRVVNSLTMGWVDQWHDSNAEYAPIIHPLYTIVNDEAARPVSAEELSATKLDKHETESLFRLETSFGTPMVNSYNEWTKRVFYPDLWDMFANMSHESESFEAAPLYALTIHHNSFDEQTLILENEAIRAGAQVYSYSVSKSSLTNETITRSRLI